MAYFIILVVVLFSYYRIIIFFLNFISFVIIITDLILIFCPSFPLSCGDK